MVAGTSNRYNEEVPKVTFLPIGKTVEFESGNLPYKGHGKPESLLDIALNFGIHLEHACGGNCACTTCHVIVKSGFNKLSESSEQEEDLLDKAPGLTPTSRLACQAVIDDPDAEIVVTIPRYTINQISEGGAKPEP